MTSTTTRCLILACGNTLRQDDGVGPWLAEWARERFHDRAEVSVIARQQWTPDLAEDIAGAESVVFLDCSMEAAAGAIQLVPVEVASGDSTFGTHHSGAPELLAMGKELFHSQPRSALLLTVGAGSIEFGERFSEPVTAALAEASSLLEKTVLQLLSGA